VTPAAGLRKGAILAIVLASYTMIDHSLRARTPSPTRSALSEQKVPLRADDDAALHPTKRINGKTIIRVRP
jgi:hypothetical protein